MSAAWLPWQAAWDAALYGPGGFYHRPEGPAGHFRTASHAAPHEVAAAITALAQEGGCGGVVDVGAGRGELLRALAGSRLNLHGVDVVPKPAGLQAGWSQGVDAVPAHAWRGALVIGWELLDVVPCPVLELDPDGEPRQVLVRPDGAERLGPPATAEQSSWCRRWWPAGGEEGDRIEVGASRDMFWRSIVDTGRDQGARAVLAVDYAHTAASRPAPGSLTGYRHGRLVPPRPDGTMDLTAHVAIDAVADAVGGTITTQAQSLTRLGVRATELVDPDGLGGFAWLMTELS